jgi:hypothetical protein
MPTQLVLTFDAVPVCKVRLLVIVEALSFTLEPLPQSVLHLRTLDEGFVCLLAD